MRPVTLALPLLMLLPAGWAQAQVGGSYMRTCTNISQDGSTLSARCRGNNGRMFDTTIDVGRCRGQGVANNGGRLSCAGSVGSTRPSDDDEGPGAGPPPGAGFGYRPPPPRFGPPPPDDDYPPPPRPRYRPPPPDDDYPPPPRRHRYDPDDE